MIVTDLLFFLALDDSMEQDGKVAQLEHVFIRGSLVRLLYKLLLISSCLLLIYFVGAFFFNLAD